jgi:plastocyanin
VARAEQPVGGSPKGRALGWVKLLRWSAVVAIVVVALVNVFAGIIPPLLIFAIVWIGGVIWLTRAEKGPAILLLVAFVAFIGLGAPFVIPTLTVPASAGDFILNLASLLAALTGIVAAIAVIRRAGDSGAPRSLGLAAAAVFVVGAIFSVVAAVTYENATERDGDVRLVAKDIEFQDTSLEAGAGDVSVFVKNEDSTLHTFTIDELDVSLDIPASKSARVTFQAPPGTYEFYCIPHEGDMEGTIEIR